MGTKVKAKIRRRLWESNPHCIWCKQPTIWWTPSDGGNMPDNAATIEHLLSRFNPIRYLLPRYPKDLMAIACNRCNNDRGAREDISFRSKVNWNTREELKNILLTNSGIHL